MTTQFFKTVDEAIKYWYLPLLIGLLFIVLGIWVLATPLSSYLSLSLLFSLSFLVTGIFETVLAITNRKRIDNWGWVLASGILNTLIGILLLVTPTISVITLPYYVGFTVLFRSLTAIGMSIELKNYGIADWRNLLLLSILGVIFAFILLWNPLLAGASLVIWTALSIISMGGFSIYFSLKLKKIHDLPEQISINLRKEYKDIQKRIQANLSGPKTEVTST